MPSTWFRDDAPRAPRLAPQALRLAPRALILVLGLVASLLSSTGRTRAQTPVRAPADRLPIEEAVIDGAVVDPVAGGFFRVVTFRRGDFNVDSVTDVSDAISILGFLFTGAAGSTCQAAGDTNADGALDVSDAAYLLGFLFTGGSAPPAPGPQECGVAPQTRALDCASYAPCPDELPLISHVLNRITFGPTEALLTRIQTRAELLDYIEEQLAPDLYDQATDEPELHSLIESLEIGFEPFASANAQVERLKSALMLDAVRSQYQLLHVIALFWNNHFHTQIDTLYQNFFGARQRGGSAVRATPALFNAADADGSGRITEDEWSAFRAAHPSAIPWTFFRNAYRVDATITRDEFDDQQNIGFWKYPRGLDQIAISAEMERREYEFFRRHAFGRFRDLLEGSAKSVAQLIYLNTFENTVVAPNENFGREYLELYSLGVDHVYTQRDIEEVSKIFTGWTAGWMERRFQSDEDLLFTGRPSAPTFALNGRDDLGFPITTNWDDGRYTWGFHFGNPVRGSLDGHDWGRKDIFLSRYGGVDSLGNPIPPGAAVQIPENTANRNVATALDEFEQLLSTTVAFRDCAKFISTKLIQLLVTDDLSALAKTVEMPADLVTLFDAADLDQSGTISVDEWEQPTTDLPNGRPPEIFATLDVNSDREITRLEYQEPDLLLAAIEAWRESDGDLRQVLRAILFSDEFLSLKFYRAKVKTPFENAASLLRGLEGTQNRNEALRTTEDLVSAGMSLLNFPDPTGESELGFDWMHTIGLLERLKLIYRATFPAAGSTAADARMTWSPASFVTRWRLTSAERAVDFFTTLLLGGDILPGQRALAIEQYESTPPGLDRVRAAAAFVASLPQFQKQ